MDAHVTVTGEWINSLPPVTRQYVIGMVLKNASKHGWDVRVNDTHWSR